MRKRGGGDVVNSMANCLRPRVPVKERFNMWRAFFLAIGMFLLVLGAECMAIDQATLANPGKKKPDRPW
jgi:hypothetical protein